MCDPGEQISQTLKREFMEEAADSHGMTDKDRLEVEEHLKVFDNAWMETIAYNFHDENDTVFKNFKLTAGNYT